LTEADEAAVVSGTAATDIDDIEEDRRSTINTMISTHDSREQIQSRWCTGCIGQINQQRHRHKYIWIPLVIINNIITIPTSKRAVVLAPQRWRWRREKKHNVIGGSRYNNTCKHSCHHCHHHHHHQHHQQYQPEYVFKRSLTCLFIRRYIV